MIYSLGDKKPSIAANAYIAPSADIIGDVFIGEESSIWFQAVLRGDVEKIEIGPRSNVQDGAVLHVAKGKLPCIIEEGVTVGHSALIHAAILRSYSFVGMSATVMDGAEIESFGFVAAGALVPPGMKVKSKTLVAGVPAKVMRKLDDSDIEMMEKNYQSYVQNARDFLRSLKANHINILNA